MRTLASLVVMLALSGCKAYEYEEEVFLDVDGSGRLRVSGSSEILDALYAAGATPEAMTALFEGPGVEIDSVRETVREGRRFVHVQSRFGDWNALCARPLFGGRECRLVADGEDELSLRVELPAPRGELPPEVPGHARLALRFHFPSSVRFHNSSGGIGRGNIIGWERTVAEHFDDPALVVEARFERRSVLATTVGILGTAAGAVVISVALALFLITRRGRRQLAEEADNVLAQRHGGR